MLTVGKLSEVSEPPLNVAARRVRPGHDKDGFTAEIEVADVSVPGDRSEEHVAVLVASGPER